MARKEQNNQIWVTDNVAHLLAFLDHCIEHGDGPKGFESKVCKHLKETLGETYKWTQISSKLGKLRVPPSGKRLPLAKLYCEGTSCLPWLDNSLTEKIEHLKFVLVLEKTTRKRYRLRSTSTLRSFAPGAVLSDQSQTTSPLTSPRTTPSLPTPLDGTVEPIDVYTDDATDTKPDPSREPSLSAAFHRPAEPALGNPITDMLHKRVQENEKNICRLNKDLMTRDNYILQLKIELDSTSKELKELKECLEIGAVSDPVALVAQLQYSESLLKQQLAQVQPLLVNIPSSRERDLNSHVWSSIKKSTRKLHRDILNACTDLQDWVQNEETNGEAFSDHTDAFKLLARRVFATGIPELTQAFSADMGMQLNLLRILVIADIFISVFEAKVFDFLSHESALLVKYRECLLRKDGPGELENIDWSAHKSLMSESSFRTDVLKTKARELASCLLRTLLPSWSFESLNNVSEHEASSELDLCREEMLSTYNILTQFQEVYVHALELKVDLILTGNRFRADFVQPGTPFSAKLMCRDDFDIDYQTAKHKKRRNATSDHTAANDSREKIVKLCSFPVIYKLPPVKRSTDAMLAFDTSLWTIDLMNFTTSEEDLINGSLDLPVCQAIVSV